MSINVHVIRCDGPPTAAPTLEGQHWINTVTGEMWFANGTASVANWVLMQADTDVKVKVSAADTTAGYLNDELTVSNGTNPTNPLEKSITSPGGDEKLNIQFDQTKLSITSTQAAQDAVGSSLVDTATVDFTYNDAGNTITASVLQSGLTFGTPVTQNPDQANASGVSTNIARADHVHNIPADAPTTNLSATTTNAEGTGTSFARNDHTHAISTGVVSTQNVDQANARADHIHNIPTAVPVDIGSANAQGTAITTVKSDHVHKGLHSLRVDSGTQRFGDINLASGDGVAITDDGAGNFTFITTGDSFAIDRASFEDFLHSSDNNLHTEYSFVDVVANGGTALVPDTIAGNSFAGAATIGTGITSNATGRGAVAGFNSVGKIQPGALRIVIEQRVRVPTLSTAGTSFTFEVGLMDGTAAGLPTNGIFFYYTHGTNSGQWRCTSRSASTSTNRDSTVAVTANQWYKLKVDINAAANSLTFYIDDVQIGAAVTTNIPTVAMFPAAVVEKANTSTTSRTANIDYFGWKLFR
jgi:hypothetical protein